MAQSRNVQGYSELNLKGCVRGLSRRFFYWHRALGDFNLSGRLSDGRSRWLCAGSNSNVADGPATDFARHNEPMLSCPSPGGVAHVTSAENEHADVGRGHEDALDRSILVDALRAPRRERTVHELERGRVGHGEKEAWRL